jgi:hypothetical protein
MAEVIPDARLVVLLRDPVHRAISHYFHARRHGMEKLPIWPAFRREFERCSTPRSISAAEWDLRASSIWRFGYLRRGLYADDLARYRELFDSSQILIVQSETLFREPNREIQRVVDFLGIAPAGTESFGNANAGRYREPDIALVRELRTFYARPNARLRAETGIDFDWPDA